MTHAKLLNMDSDVTLLQARVVFLQSGVSEGARAPVENVDAAKAEVVSIPKLMQERADAVHGAEERQYALAGGRGQN